MSQSLMIGLLILLVILIILSALFSAAETAYSSISATKLEIKVQAGERGAKLIKKHYKSFGWTLSTILISNNLVNVSSAALLTYIFTTIMHGSSMVAIISTFVMTPILVIFGEITPKLLAKKYSYSYLSKVAYVIEGLNWVFFPITFPLSKITLQSKITHTEREIKTMISIANEEGILEKNEATLAKNALDLDSKNVGSVMTKLENVVFLEKGISISDAKIIFSNSGYSRLPVKNNKKFIGLVILKDIIFNNTGIIDKYIIDAPNVSRYIIVSKALEILRGSSSHLATVSKSQTNLAVVGIVTVEDIIEELVGEIYDEHDIIKNIKEVGLHKYLVAGSVSMFELSKVIKMDFRITKDICVKKWVQKRINRKIKVGLEYTFKDKIKFKVMTNKHGEDTSFEIIQK